MLPAHDANDQKLQLIKISLCRLALQQSDNAKPLHQKSAANKSSLQLWTMTIPDSFQQSTQA
jgi:hypothetical protein